MLAHTTTAHAKGDTHPVRIVGLEEEVDAYNPLRSLAAAARVIVVWTAGTEAFDASLEDEEESEESPRENPGQWEIISADDGVDAPETGGFPPGTSSNLDCACNVAVKGHALDGCGRCACGNLYRYGFFGVLQVKFPGVPAFAWAASGGLHKFTHKGGCIWHSDHFSLPGCTDYSYGAPDIYRYEADVNENVETLTLVRVSGTACPLVKASWCLAKISCSFDCRGVWTFFRMSGTGAFDNVLASSIVCSVCVSPKYPKLKVIDQDATCACGATVKLPLRFNGPATTVDELESHGLIDVALWTHFLGWDNLWELSYPQKYEKIHGSESAEMSGGVGELCNPSHVQLRGWNRSYDVPDVVIWNAEGSITGDSATVTIDVLLQVHAEDDSGQFWNRLFRVELTCEEFAEAIALGYVNLPEFQNSDAAGVYEGGGGSIKVFLSGSYPEQEELTSSDGCGSAGEVDTCGEATCRWDESFTINDTVLCAGGEPDAADLADAISDLLGTIPADASAEFEVVTVSEIDCSGGAAGILVCLRYFTIVNPCPAECGACSDPGALPPDSFVTKACLDP